MVVAIAAQRGGATRYKYDTSQAFRVLYRDVDDLYRDVDEDLYARAPDWLPELVLEG